MTEFENRSRVGDASGLSLEFRFGSLAAARRMREVSRFTPKRPRGPLPMEVSSLGRKQTFNHSFDQFVRESEERRRTAMPRALAVFKLMTSSILVACWTGKSPGFSPLRTRPVYRPNSRQPLRKFAP